MMNPNQVNSPPSDQNSRALFEVDPAQLVALCPSIEEASQTMHKILPPLKFGAPEEAAASSSEDSPGDRPDAPTYNRQTRRQLIAKFERSGTPLVLAGIQLLASYEDGDTEGQLRGRRILDESTAGLLTGAWDGSITRGAQALRHFRVVSHAVAQEVDEIRNGDAATNYLFVKQLAIDSSSHHEKNAQALIGMASHPSRTLLAVAQLRNLQLPKTLAEELETGRFDPFIAREILRFVHEAPTTNSDMLKIRQLGVFATCFADTLSPDSTIDVYDQLSQTVAEWPLTERQIVTAHRQLLQSRLLANSNLDSTVKNLADGDKDKLAVAFEQSIEDFVSGIARGVEIKNKRDMALIAEARAKDKRKRPKSKRSTDGEDGIQAAETDAPREPRKIVVCNLKEGIVDEDVEAAIDDFVSKSGAGNKLLRRDLTKMVEYTARTDLPATHRRGIKPMIGVMVKFGEDDKLWSLFEFKPTEAAGLSTQTDIAKNSRIYFIKMPDKAETYDAFGIVEIGSRSDQTEFISRIRTKTKRNRR